jgi:hypothetical protein
MNGALVKKDQPRRNEGQEARMKTGHEETKSAKKEQKKNFALFVSSWLIL